MFNQRLIHSVALTTIIVVLALLIIACGGTASTPPVVEGPIIELRNNQFHPADVEIPVGSTVTWWWNDGMFGGHNVMSGSFQAPEQNSGTFDHHFAEPGTYTYVCTLHEKMQGTITVYQPTAASTTP